MSQPSDGLELTDVSADEQSLGSDRIAPRTRSQTISVTIPAPDDDELDDDEVVKDDLAVPREDTTTATAATSKPETESVKDAARGSAPGEKDSGSDAASTPAADAVRDDRSFASAALLGKKTASTGVRAKKTPVTNAVAERPLPQATPERASTTASAKPPRSAPASSVDSDAASVSKSPAASASRPESREEPVEQLQSLSARRSPHVGAEGDHSLTVERLLDERAAGRSAPEGGIRRIVYEASGHLINLGDSKKVRAEKDLTQRIAKPFVGSARFVPVLTRKGGVGKTTVSVLLGMALADARDDRVIAVDANPDRGSLHDRVSGSTDYTVRDAVQRRADLSGYTEFSTLVARDTTRLDVLASDSELTTESPFDDDDYDAVAELASQYYSIVLTDSGTGMVHDVMRAMLGHADSVVLVSGTSIDEARMTSETISWLEANGHEGLARNAVVVVNSRSASTPLIKLDELDAHFGSRVRAVIRLPYDPALAAGSPISFARLKPATRHAARELAASVVEGLPTQRPSYL